MSNEAFFVLGASTARRSGVESNSFLCYSVVATSGEKNRRLVLRKSSHSGSHENRIEKFSKVNILYITCNVCGRVSEREVIK